MHLPSTLRRVALAVSLAHLAACSAASTEGLPSDDGAGSSTTATTSPSGAGGAGNATTGAGGAGSTTTSAGAGGSTGSGGASSTYVAPPACQKGCMVPADCALAAPGYDASHYACDAGVCVYTGCHDDQDCASAGAGFACRKLAGSAFPYCLPTCGAPADCAQKSPAFDADNYACTGGLCEYTGCHDDAECKGAFGATYVCAKVYDGLDLATCVPGCASPADCAQNSAAFDADNYACESGACVYRGCNSTAECEQAIPGQGYVCK